MTLVELPANTVTYRFTSTHRVAGLSGLPDGKDVEITAGEENARILLTTNPTSVLAAADRSAARQLLAIRQLFVRDAKQRSPEQEATEIAQERVRKLGDGVYLIVEATGRVTVPQPCDAREYDWGWVAMDAVDKESIAAKYQPLIDRAVAAFAVADSETSDVTRDRDTIELYLPDGRVLQSMTIKGGSARVTISRQFTNADRGAIELRLLAILKNPRLVTPMRLLADAVRSQYDRLEAFLFAWGALETLVNPAVAPLKCESGEWIACVPPKYREEAERVHDDFKSRGHPGYSLAEGVGVFSLVHGDGASGARMAEFRRISGAYRIPLTHLGKLPPPEAADATIALVRGLLRVTMDAPAASV
jgi:hypothetical protein